MEEMRHEIKDEEIPRHSMTLGVRLKQFRGKDGQLMAMAVPASTPYSREEKEIEKEMKNFIYADEIHHPDHYTWKGVECKDVIETMTRGLSGIEAYYMGNIIKYLYRYPKKGTLGTDLAKAAQYMEFLKEVYRND
ncbi:DUF3310 domain-containing protein [uncultured Dialister sp.]|uniref:DUF3310 domain-containing protein n=1 Tax=uncultured Dialister sp. TaxID=278064 RepID=UPI00206A4B5B|nr:DUF3310 domain-containing protein [uncultured Dialister sp.]DAE67626.1 MAG TPA: nucelotide kinase [Caudoviricetes sp.]